MELKELLKNYRNFSEEKKKLFDTLLKEKGIELTDHIILPQERTGKPMPASFAQRRLWFLEQFEPGSPLYIIPIAVRVKGDFNEQILKDTILKIVERHEVLRTSFKSIDGEVFQTIHSKNKINFKKIDVSVSEDKDEEIKNIIMRESITPFNLTEFPLFRVVLIKVKENEHILLIPMHHIISDNWSTAVFVKELLEIYKAYKENKEINLQPLSIQYADFAAWQIERFKKNIYKEQTEYWTQKLSDSNEVLDIITDYKRPPVQTFNGAFELFEIEKDNLEKLKQLAKKTDTTLFMILISAFQVMLYRYTGQNDLNIGTPIANRNRTEIETLIGFFINTLVMRGNLSGNPTFKELLERTKETALEAYQNQDVPFEDIVDKLNLERDISRTALFQAMFVLNNAQMEKLELPGVEFEIIDVDTQTTKFDLVLSLTESNNLLKGKFEYNTDLFKSFTIKQLIKTFQNILIEIGNNSGLHIDEIKLNEKELSILTGEENKNLIKKNVIELIKDIAKEYPERKAIGIENHSLTYNELIAEINKLSNYLKNSGVSQGDIVSVFLDRSLEYVISMFAVMNIGGTYLPLDIDYPLDRLNYLLQDSQANFIISKNELVAKLNNYEDKIIDVTKYKSAEAEVENVESSKDNDVAYIIYTSGSTGNPKGVEVTHSALSEHIQIMKEHFAVNENDKELEFAAFNFDASIEQILVPLISGAELYLRGNNIWTPQEFTKIINDEKLTIINPPTIVWEELTKYWFENPEEAPSKQLKLCIAGGDEMKTDLIAKWMQSPMENVRLLNAYGPTETVITASTAEINKLDSTNLYRTPIGKPLAGRKFYVVDKNLNILPKGFPGELCIGGNILAKGYLNREKITKEKFVPDVTNRNAIMYRTGDFVKINEDDNIEFLGRIDTQVKLRGFRIELGEIETVIKNNNSIDNAIVTTYEENGNKFLVAYIVTKDNSELDKDEIKNHIKNKLPEYMLPSVFIRIDKIPLTASGKVDKKSLPKPEGIAVKSEVEFVEPRSETETIIANIVANVLNIEKVGVYDNFFELGGHSMLAMQVIAKINEQFRVEIPIKSLFENPTIDGIGKAIFEAQILEQTDDELEELLKEIGGIPDESTIMLSDNDTDNKQDQTT